MPVHRLVLTFCSLLPLIIGCSESEVDKAFIRLSNPNAPAPTDEAAIVRFCGDCHAMPQPTSFVKARWKHEVEQGIAIYEKSGRKDLIVPDVSATIRWFQQTAPESQRFIPREEAKELPRFSVEEIPWQGEQPLVSVAHVTLEHAGADAAWLLSDMGSGYLWRCRFSENGAQGELLTRVSNPAHAEGADLDNDGELDYVVADLGGFNLQDQALGSLFWLKRVDDHWTRTSLRMGLVRPCDVRTLDANGDGKQDLVVAEFGMHFVGGIHLLEQSGLEKHVPKFRESLLDQRAGAIHLPVVDWDKDGREDVLALISQQHETVMLYKSAEQMKSAEVTGFDPVTLYQAGDPAFASSGIQVVDLDGDGDQDVLYTHGDTFDDGLPKPFHGVSWLENRGAEGITSHLLAELPAAYRAVCGDFDGDQDLDVVAVSLLSQENVATQPSGTFEGAIWLEQECVEGKRSFKRHRIEANRCESATCVVLDIEGDGDLDVLAFPFSLTRQATNSLRLFRNDSPSQSRDSLRQSTR
jgi:hypothetical protein